MDQQLQVFENRVRTLNDKDLVEQVRQLFHREKRIGDAILLGLKEIKQRRLFAEMGYSSLFEMLVKNYHLSETASYQRVNALKLIESVPEAQEAVLNGEVSLSNAALAQAFIQRSEKETNFPMNHEEKINIIESIKGKTHKEAQITLAEANPIVALPANKEKPLSKYHTQLQIVVDEETLSLLKDVQGLLSHIIPDGDYNAVLKYMGTHVSELLRKKKGRSAPASMLNCHEDDGSHGDSDADTNSNLTSASKSTSTLALDSTFNIASKVKNNGHLKHAVEVSLFTDSNMDSESLRKTTDDSKRRVRARYIPQETKRRVYARSEGRCEFIGANGHRCESHYQVEIDHIVAWSQGGTNDEANLRMVCKTHNLFRTKETHGFWFSTPDRDGQEYSGV